MNPHEWDINQDVCLICGESGLSATLDCLGPPWPGDADLDLFNLDALVSEPYGPPPRAMPVCECGAAKLGTKPYSIGHSSYCPVCP